MQLKNPVTRWLLENQGNDIFLAKTLIFSRFVFTKNTLKTLLNSFITLNNQKTSLKT
jgi:hypothetical protein